MSIYSKKRESLRNKLKNCLNNVEYDLTDEEKGSNEGSDETFSSIVSKSCKRSKKSNKKLNKVQEHVLIEESENSASFQDGSNFNTIVDEDDEIEFVSFVNPKDKEKKNEKEQTSTEILFQRLEKLTENKDNSIIDDNFEMKDNIDDNIDDFIYLKINYNGTIKKLLVKSTDMFVYHSKAIAELFDLPSNSIHLLWSNEIITMSDTPKSLGITLVDIIDCVLKSKSEIDKQKVEKCDRKPGSIKLKFRDNEKTKRNEPMILYVDKSEKFIDIFKKYSTKKGIILNDLIFKFDGERIEDEDTPESLDIEEDTMIDVHIKKY